MTRHQLEALHDQLYVLEAAVEDVERDLAGAPTKQDYADAVAWLLQAAKPLAGFSSSGAFGGLPTKR